MVYNSLLTLFNGQKKPPTFAVRGSHEKNGKIAFFWTVKKLLLVKQSP
jgi:hypothetical protein